jgi:hypothetical protein
MSVSSGGVSAGSKTAGPNPWDIAAIAADPVAFKERMADLSAATAKNLQAVELVGQAQEIKELRIQAADARAKASDAVHEAGMKAKEIIKEAENAAARTTEQAAATVDTERRLIRAAQERLRAREAAVKAKEESHAPREKRLVDRAAELDAGEKRLARLKSSYEDRMRRLKEAIKGAKL